MGPTRRVAPFTELGRSDVGRDAGPSADPGRQAATDTRRGHPRNHQPPAEGANGRPKRPVHTVRVSTLFL